jgi:hypothetical protein
MVLQNSSDQIFTLNADGWSLGGGNTTIRTLTIINGDVTLSAVASSGTYTLPASTSTLASLGLAETFSALKTFSSGLTVSVGTVTITPLNVAGIVHNNSSGVLSTSLIVSADITANNITNSLFRQSGANTIVGNPTGSTANVTDITLGSTLTFVSGALQTTALSGDVTTSANSFVTTIANNAVTTAKINNSAVTYAKLQNETASTLLGNPTGSTAAPSEITLGATLQFSGSAVQTKAFTGDVTTSANSFATTVNSYNGGTVFGTMAAQNSNSVSITGGSITGMSSPTNPTDVANKSYVDAAVQGLSFKETVSASTTANLTATYANGTAGVGATLTNSGTQVAFATDGYTASLNDRILVKNQTSQLQNGIYTVTTLGSGSTNWVLTRSTDTNTPASLVGAYVFVDQGTLYADTSWAQITPATITIGTNNIVWTQFSGAGTYTAGTGLTLTGTQFSLTSPVTTSLGGTGLTSIGTANQILGVNTGATGLEYKTVAGTGSQITVTPSAGALTLSLPAAVSTTNLTLTGLTANSFLYSGTGGLLTTTAAPTNGQLLIGSTGAAPVAAALTAGSGVAITNGAGSITVGLATIANNDILANISGGTAVPSANTLTATIDSAIGNVQGDILYRNSSGWVVLAPGTSGQFLETQGAAANPIWAAVNLGTAASITGTLPVTNGGTGRTTLTNHGLLIGAGTVAITQLSGDPAGTVLIGNGASADPSFSATPTLGVAGTTLGTLALTGNTSGTITIQPQAAAGTYNFNLPTSAGSAGQVLTSQAGGSSAMTWTTPTTGTVTSIATNNGITGGTITSTGTIGLATIANNDLLANISGSTAAPSATTLTAFIDSAIGSTQGDVLYRNASSWVVLAPGTSGQFLETQGAAANPQWASGNSGTVTSVATGSGLTGGTITSTGTISVATNGITNSLFRQSAGLSVVGNSTNATANVADITGTANQVLVVNAAGTSLAFGALNLASSSAVTGVLPVANGGTGQSTLTNHGVLIGAGTSAITQLAAGAAGTILTGQGAADPSFSATPTLGVAGTTLGTLSLAGNTSGTITIKSQAAAGTYNFNLPTTVGTAGQVLTSQAGGATAMTWTTPTTGTVTSVTFTGDGTLLSSTPSSAVTTSGTLTAALANAAGGTVLGRATGTTGAPSYTISPVLGIAATSTGTLGLANGAAGGDVVTIQNNSATAGAYNFNLPSTAGSTGQVLTSAGGGSSAMTWTTLDTNNYGSFVYYASNFENPNNANWAINALAYATVDATNNSFVIRAFNDTTETGTGFYLTVPTGATNMAFTWKVRPATAPGATNNKIIMRLYSRHIPSNAAIGAWSAATNFTQWTIPNNADYQYFNQTITLATLGLTAGDLYAFELTREASITNNVAGLLYLIEFSVTFT